MGRYQGNAAAVRSLVRETEVHRDVYVDPEVFDLEMEHLFANTWIYIGHDSQVPNAGDYFGLLAYITMNEGNENAVQALRHEVRDSKKVATVLGFGPRFLHSTGQAYKGGPNSGVFLQVTCDDAAEVAVPGQKYTFGVVKAAQARGDFQVLADRGRRALRVHLPKDVNAGLQKLNRAIQEALS